MLAIHGLSGADILATLHGIGKATVIKVSKTGRFSLSKLGVDKADMKSVEARATNFICDAYGNKIIYFYDRMRDRPKKVALKNRKSGASSLKLCSLPPTSDVFNKNVHRG